MAWKWGIPKAIICCWKCHLCRKFQEAGGEERRFPPPHHSQFKMNITQLVAGFPAPRELGFRLGNSAWRKNGARYDLGIQGLLFKGHWARIINISAHSYFPAYICASRSPTRAILGEKLHRSCPIKAVPIYFFLMLKNIYIQNRQEKPGAKKIGDFYRSCFCKKLPRQQVTKFQERIWHFPE